jgi:hypothetical protein
MKASKLIASALTIVFLSTSALINFKSGEKVRLIHKGQEIVVSTNAVDAHLAHGDIYWGC